MAIHKCLLASLFLVLILGVANGFDYHEKELETEEGLQAMYDRWRDHHKVTEKSPERFNVFKYNVQNIHNHNKMNKPYKLKVNRFATMTKHEFVSTYADSKIGHYATLQGIRMNNLTAAPPPKPDDDISNLPPRIDWREMNAVTPVKNQGQCGSCFAFAATGAIEGINAIRTGQLVPVSEQQILDCDTTGRTNACGGGLVCGVFQWAHEHGGIATQESYPYVGKKEVCDPSRFGHKSITLDGQEYLPNNCEPAMMKKVAEQPIVIAMDPGGDGFMFYSEGLYTGPCGNELMHAMLIVGYDQTPDGKKYWIVKNSWGEGWGEKGYIRMERGTPMPEGLCSMNTQVNFPIKSPETRNNEL